MHTSTMYMYVCVPDLLANVAVCTVIVLTFRNLRPYVCKMCIEIVPALHFPVKWQFVKYAPVAHTPVDPQSESVHVSVCVWADGKTWENVC